LQQKTANFESAMHSRVMQRGAFPEEKQKNELAQTRVSFHKNNNNNKGRQLPVGLRFYISAALQQKTANFKVAIASRPNQWSVLTEEKRKNELAQIRVSFHKNNNNNKGRQLHVGLRLYISAALQQKTGNFKVAIASRLMQWSVFTEGKQKNQIAT
jgi:outer membrane translocation and assembly module TamA